MAPLFFETVPVAELVERGLIEPAPEPAQATVLVVDDEHTIADTMVIILRHKGFRALAAYGGEAALELARTNPPDIVITDVMMPGMNGIDLAIAVHRGWPRCRVLLFSGNTATVDLLEDAHRQGYDFPLLSKPVHPEELLDRLSTLRRTSDEAA